MKPKIYTVNRREIMSIMLDVERLKTMPSSEVKLQITTKISELYRENKFDENEINIALEIIQLLMNDSEVKIRQILANNLKYCSDLPRAIALKLARDIAEVSAPILQYSLILTQSDLIEIAKSTKQIAALVAIAKRTDIQDSLANTLIETREETVVEVLTANTLANIAQEGLEKIFHYFKDSPSMLSLLVERGGLSVNLAEKMLHVVSQDLRAHLIKHYAISSELAESLTKETKESATLYLISTGNNLQQTEALVAHLYENQKLSNSIILRALCKGDLPFFEIGLAKLAQLTPQTAHEMIWKQGPAGFAALYKKANMPKGTFNAVNVILQFALQEIKEGEVAGEDYVKTMIQRITHSGYDKKIGIMEYFMVLMKSKVKPLDIVQVDV